MSELFSAERYLVRRKVFKLAGGAFHVYDPQGNVVAYSEQKAFKLKEDIRVFADEAKTRELLVIQARQIMDFSAAYDVTDAMTGEKVGALRRCGGKSILRDEWTILDPSDTAVGTIIEDSMGYALIRRFLTNLVPQKYDVFFPSVTTGQKIANMDQQFNPFVYKLDVDLSTDPAKQFDRRLAISAAILLAAIEGRQN
ncbi:MAG: hypothetical protein CVT59_06190 [Actinobacteria bacterium HGW-Actinobacteria-1]|jgi:uncharacterized protein YxjI|nr:MAG: hypothetical protein CVT59_06190 [Actinobacteria bacterium HGW-Actinobacteria-1]